MFGNTSRFISLAASLLALSVTLPAQADPPRLAEARPNGLKRGELTELTFTGTALNNETRLLAPFEFQPEGDAQPSEDGKSWTIRIKPSPTTRLGVHLVRLQTTDGLSNLLPIEIGQFPQTLEAEPNDSHEAAQDVGETPLVVEGRAEGADVDYFRFAGKKGQKLVIDARAARIGSGLDPQIRLTSAANLLLAASDDVPGLDTDALLLTTLPEDGQYVVEISDTKYQGTNRPIYRLLIGEIPVASTLYPLGGRQRETVGFELNGGTLEHPLLAAATLPTATTALSFPAHVPSPAIAGLQTEILPTLEVGTLPELRESEDADSGPLSFLPPATVNGRIGKPGEEDRYIVAVKPGQKLRLILAASALGSPLDGILRALKTDGAEVANADDTTIKALDLPGQKKPPDYVVSDPSLEITVPDGVTELTLALKDLQGRGGPEFSYRLHVTPIVPSFEVQMADSELSLPRGGTAQLAVAVTRAEGFSEPVTISVADLPPGVTARGGILAADQSIGWLSLTASPDMPPEARDLQVVGNAKKGDTTWTSRAVRILTLAEQANIPIKKLQVASLTVAPALAQPLAIEAPDQPVPAPHGQETLVTLKITRPGDDKSELTVTAQALPKGFEGPELKVPGDQNEAQFKLNIKPEATLGLSSIALVAKGKIADKDTVIQAPAVTLEVIAPLALELATPGPIEIKAGETAEIRGKILRKGSFKDPVTIKLDNLPAGAKAEPVTVEADKEDFTLSLTTEAEAAPAEQAASLVVGFKIADKDYPFPAQPITIKLIKP